MELSCGLQLYLDNPQLRRCLARSSRSACVPPDCIAALWHTWTIVITLAYIAQSAVEQMAEVAGLVLGGIPLIISGLEHYEEAVRLFRRYRQASEHFESLKRNLRFENDIFLNCIEGMLKGRHCSGDLEALIHNVGDIGHWQLAMIDKYLKESLGRCYRAFWDELQALQTHLANLRECLKIDGQGKVRTCLGVLFIPLTCG